MDNPFLNRKKELLDMKIFRMQKNRFGRNEKMILCKKCKQTADEKYWQKNEYVCSNCGYRMPMPAADRIQSIVDEGSFEEINAGLRTKDPLQFPGYSKKLKQQKQKTKMEDALVTGIGSIDGTKVALAVLDSAFFMGSMGTVVGEKLVLLVEEAVKKNLPLIIFSASGGARMQEGLFSLFQMAKTSAAIEAFSQKGGFYISVLTHPTTGGVSASFASLGDIILAEPEALIGFAGPRVIEQTIGKKLPNGFQRAEFQMEHGFVDAIVERKDMQKVLKNILQLHTQD